MEAFFAGLIGFLVGKGVAPADAQSIAKALETYLGFEPPVGLTGFVLSDMTAGQRKKSNVVVRGKTYNAHALEALTKYDEVSVLAKSGDYLQVARTISHMKDVGTLGCINLVKVLEELTLLKKIETVGTVEHATIDEITTIRDLIHRPFEVIVNSSFEEEFVGWKITGTVTRDVGFRYGYSAKFSANKIGALLQKFSVPIGVDWFKSIYLMLLAQTADSDALMATFYYSDGETSSENLQVSEAMSWERKPLSPTGGKYIEMFDIAHSDGIVFDSYVDDVNVVF